MPNGGRGNRNMYYLTGLPGWMRFGYSPGWQGRSPTGLGPGATYMMTGQWPTPQAQAYWQAMQAGQTSYPAYGAPTTAPGAMPFAPQMAPEQELDFLKKQADVIKGQLEQMEARMRELETEGK
ncbi:MAG: hypothetical protein IMY77_00705 [Chloroflexi bacterium]|nr:hypothetical protein [Chloroflexota bacterium]